MVAKLSSFLRPMLTLPGLIRYLAKARAQSGNFLSKRCPLKWKSPTMGTVMPCLASSSTMGATAAAAASVLTVTRTSSEPALARAATCLTVEGMSAVSVFVIDCTTIGASEPTRTWPTVQVTDFLRRSWAMGSFILTCGKGLTTEDTEVHRGVRRDRRGRAAVDQNEILRYARQLALR